MRAASLVVLLLGSLLPSVARSAIIERDWLEPGDGLLTYDTVNRREWLDIPYTIEQFPTPSLRDVFPRLQLVQEATLPGGVLDGFTVATSSEVLALAESAGIDVTTSDLMRNEVAVRNLLNLLGTTRQFPPNDSIITRGLVDDNIADCDCALVMNLYANFGVAAINSFLTSESSDDRPARSTGVFVYRQVPEPATAAIVATLLAAVTCYRVVRLRRGSFF